MHNINDRIKDLRESKGLKQQDVATRLGVSRVAVTKWESGQTSNLKLSNLIGLCELFDVDPSDLIAGEISSRKYISHKSNRSRFDVLDVRASCGSGAINEDYPQIVSCIEMDEGQAVQLVGTANKTGSVKVVSAMGDSMIPTIQPNDLLFVDTRITEFNREGVYLIFQNGCLMCKRLQYIGKVLTVISDNEYYKPWPWEERLEDTRIVGKILRALPMNMKDFGD